MSFIGQLVPLGRSWTSGSFTIPTVAVVKEVDGAVGSDSYACLREILEIEFRINRKTAVARESLPSAASKDGERPLRRELKNLVTGVVEYEDVTVVFSSECCRLNEIRRMRRHERLRRNDGGTGPRRAKTSRRIRAQLAARHGSEYSSHQNHADDHTDRKPATACLAPSLFDQKFDGV
jgi:hypothetical protein